MGNIWREKVHMYEAYENDEDEANEHFWGGKTMGGEAGWGRAMGQNNTEAPQDPACLYRRLKAQFQILIWGNYLKWQEKIQTRNLQEAVLQWLSTGNEPASPATSSTHLGCTAGKAALY